MSIRKPVTGLLCTLFILWSALALAVQPLEITDVYVDEGVFLEGEDQPTIVFTIIGTNFDNGGTVELWLGEILLRVLIQSDTMVTAALPVGMQTVLAGSYQLLATTGGGTVRQNEFDGVTIGAQGATGPQGEQGPSGPQGTQGATGPQGEQGPSGPQGEQGPSGPQGEQGPIGFTGSQGTQGPAGPQGAPGLINETCNLYRLTGFPAPLSLVTESAEATCDDSVDNDCDGLVDLQDFDCGAQTAPENCSDSIDNDNDGLFDCSDPDCALEPTCLCNSVGPEPNETSLTAFDLGALQDTSSDIRTVTANIIPDGDADWYQFTAVDANDLGGDTFAVDVRLIANPGAQFSIRVWKISSGQLAAVCHESAPYDTAQSFCNGSPPINFVQGGFEGNDDTAVYLVEVVRVSAAGSTCDSYTLEVSNGAYVVSLDIAFAELATPLSTSAAAESHFEVFGRVYVPGFTDRSQSCGTDSRLVAEVGVGVGPVPTNMTWWPAECNAGSENLNGRHEYSSLPRAPLVAGNYIYVYRFSGDGGATWTYATPQGVLEAN